MKRTDSRSYRIEITRGADPRGKFVRDSFHSFGLTRVEEVVVSDIYYITGLLDQKQAEHIARELLCDPVVEHYDVGEAQVSMGSFEVLFNAGVTDPKEESARKAISDLGIAIQSVKTGNNYEIKGTFDTGQLQKCAELFLYNPLIQHLRHRDEEAYSPSKYVFHSKVVDLSGDLLALSREMGLSLSRTEMEVIKDYFGKERRMPSDVELETVAQTWSEHCRHKTFLGKILFDGEQIDNLLRKTVMQATREIDHPLCLSVFHDNSGVIDFDEEYGICFKVETHNHPSALEPYGGAATGIGGVIRDILGTGLGAKPILNTDVFCFGIPEFDFTELPQGILHPKTIIKGVIRGVRDYGNRMGIPTASGAIYFDDAFLYNPLVYCGCVGLIRKDRIEKRAQPGDTVLLVGGRTGRDGIHGVTFASAELSGESEKSCVQIGNPIMERRVMDCLLRASEEGLLHSVTDCGGGGLSSAVGEMGKETGVTAYLDRVPLKYEGLSPREIWISESQERMVLAVPKEHLERTVAIFKHEGVEATVIGEFTGDKRLILYYRDKKVCDLDMGFLHDGLPMPVKKAKARTIPPSEVDIPKPVDLNSMIIELISGLNACSREWVIREYDHEVQGGSAVKPLVGVLGIGPQDAVVVRPRLDRKRGVVVSCGLNPGFGRLDAYKMALSVVDEALRNLVAAGGDIAKAAMLDNFCLSSPEREEVLGDLVLSARGCYDAAKCFRVPFISGKDSLYNEWVNGRGTVYSIPPTLLISAIGIVEDIDRCITMDLKEIGSPIYLVGETKDELGGSEYFRMLGIRSGTVPGVNFRSAPKIMQAIHGAIKKGMVNACHDLSEGGLALALCEMAFSGDIGVEVDVKRVPFRGERLRYDTILFSESNSRFLVELKGGREDEFTALFGGLPIARIGRTTAERCLKVLGGERKLVDLPLSLLRKKWLRKVV
ncbi:MAG: phosphoribosylformylglycinamidine synthase subunit PurL [candidate division WOR-3 bacterium]|nr:MAG: phosphoribosylformylglycinamidine synthase subunit PurL [candidate division WOR-3 bacterium]